jgi:hypothetical protein
MMKVWFIALGVVVTLWIIALGVDLYKNYQ